VTTDLPAIIPNLRLFQVNINFHGELDNDSIKKTFDKGLRWIQYMPNCWFVLSSSELDRWYARLYPLLGDRDTLMITEVDPETLQCWIQMSTIEWLTDARDQMRKSRGSGS
jgi:hypothetical protein